MCWQCRAAFLYAGGDFITAGDVTNANYIAQWNGNTWSSVGSGFTGDVQALRQCRAPTCMQAGGFAKSGSSNVFFVAQWNGNTWSALGPGLNGGVKALAASGSTLYAGGGFNYAKNAPSVHFNGIAQWDGSSWSGLGPGMSCGGSPTRAGAGGVGHQFICRGRVHESGRHQCQSHCPMERDQLVAVGFWDGRNGRQYSVCVGAGSVVGRHECLYAGGEFTTAGGNSANYIAQWDGTNWSSLGAGLSSGRFNDTEVTALAVSGGDLYVGGVFITAGDVAATNIAKWDGSNWSSLGSGMNSAVTALAISGNTLYAGGDFITEGGNFCPFMASAYLQALPPAASAVLSGNNFILTWPVSATGFTLESTANLAPPVVWTTKFSSTGCR